MKCFNLAAVLFACVSVDLAQPVAAADSHNHHHHEAAAAKLQLDHGRKWPTDAPLRQAIIASMGIKPYGHDFTQQMETPQVVRFMSMTGG